MIIANFNIVGTDTVIFSFCSLTLGIHCYTCALGFRREGLILGLAAKPFSIAGPVIVCGLAASAVYGIILVICQQFIR